MTRIRRDAVPVGTKLSYAMGGAAEGAVGWAFNGFSFIIYTIIFGMPGSLVGAAIFLSIVLDAVSDPLVGYVSDRWRSALGRRHPFIYFASIPLGASIFGIYAPPDVLLAPSQESWVLLGYQATPEQWGLALWLFVFASLLKFFLTCYHLPHLALGSELTDNYLERTRIFRYNTLFSFGGGATLAWAFYNVYFVAGPQPGLDVTWFALSVAVFGAVVIFLTAWLTRDQIPYLMQPPASAERLSLTAFFREASVVFGNRNYMMLFFGLLCLSPLTGIRETLNANMSLYYWALPPRLIGYFPFFSMASYFVAVAVVAALNDRFDKGGTMRLAVIACVVAAAVPVLGRSFGVFPDNGSPLLFPLLGGFVFLYYGSLAVLSTSVFSAIGDVVDEQELRTGRREEGIFYAVRTFFAKLSNGIGHLLAGIAIDVIGFPPHAVVGAVPSGVIFHLGIVEGLISAVPALGSIYFYGRYRIDRQRHQQIMDELETRRAGAAPLPHPSA